MISHPKNIEVMKNNLFFCGIKHSGKTLFSFLTAERLNLPCFDLDDEVKKRTGCVTIREYYIVHGKESFMNEEREALLSLENSITEPYILSLGGGGADNRALLNIIKSGDRNRLIYLRRPEELILPRILSNGIPPFLESGNVEKSFHELYSRRDEIYLENSDLVIELGEYGDKNSKVDIIIKALEEAGYAG